MHRITRRIGLCLAAALLSACVFTAGCDNSVIVREPVEGPPATAAPTPEPTSVVTQAPHTLAPVFTLVPTVAPTTVPVQEPTPEPTPEATLQTLKEDDVSPEVRRLQERLAELGYLDLAPDEMTETYGSRTKQAVERFQRQNGLEVDGQAGELTLTAVYAADAPSYEPQQLPLSGVTIGLDPGHQARGNSEHEPVAPGSSDTKPKVSSGTSGVSTHVDEYIVNLAVGLRLRDILQSLGANVLMTRDTNDVNISNAERAQMMNNAGVDLVVRLHCDGEDDQSLNGAFILIPSGSYTTDIQSQSRSAAEAVLSAFIAETGANSLGLSERSDQTGFNWSTVPVINIEMGHMSNPAEDQRLVTEEYQQLCAQGIANGLVNYFS